MDEHQKKCQAFLDHMDETVDALLGVEYDDKFDLVIELNGKSIRLPLHADLFSELESLIRREKEDGY